MAKLLWELKPRFAVALVARGMLIVTSHTNYDVTSCPVVMRRYANTDRDEQWYKTSQTQVSLAFCKTVFVVKYKLTTYMVCAVVVGTAIRHSTSCASRRAAASADRIVVNSYNHVCYICSKCIHSLYLLRGYIDIAYINNSPWNDIETHPLLLALCGGVHQS